MSRILVVEDDPAIQRGLVDNLTFESYDVLTAGDGETGYRIAKDQKPDLILLDLMLPNMSGFEVCKKLRAEGLTASIIMLTARGEETDRVLGLDLGADDYLTKPFSVRELLARIRAVLRRAQRASQMVEVLRCGDVIVDFRKFEVTRGGVAIELTRKEFGLLRLLASRDGEVVTREQLLDEVWGYDAMPTTRTVDNHVASLRSKIEPDPTEPRYLITVFGVGYKWTGDGQGETKK